MQKGNSTGGGGGGGGGGTNGCPFAELLTVAGSSFSTANRVPAMCW